VAGERALGFCGDGARWFLTGGNGGCGVGGEVGEAKEIRKGR